MKKTIINLLCLLMCIEARGGELFSLREVDVGYKNYALLNPRARDALIYPEPPKEALEISIRSDILSHFYWDSLVHGTTTESQYQGVGLEMRLGLRLTDEISAGFYHHSEHLLDRAHTYMDKFPVVDAFEVRLRVYTVKQGREALF